jgi:hypothetical protein
LFDTILADSDIEVVLSGVQMPRMNSIMERWIQSCRRELLDRTLMWNQAHLLHALCEYERHYNDTDPTGESPAPVPYARSPIRSPIRATSPDSTSGDLTASPASSTSTNTPPDLRG